MKNPSSSFTFYFLLPLRPAAECVSAILFSFEVGKISMSSARSAPERLLLLLSAVHPFVKDRQLVRSTVCLLRAFLLFLSHPTYLLPYSMTTRPSSGFYYYSGP